MKRYILRSINKGDHQDFQRYIRQDGGYAPISKHGLIASNVLDEFKLFLAERNITHSNFRLDTNLLIQVDETIFAD